jgi:uncharacterized membrane protein
MMQARPTARLDLHQAGRAQAHYSGRAVIHLLSDLGALAISVALAVMYQLFLRWRLRADPHHTVHSVNMLARAQWVEAMMGSRGNEILAVQTLRNSVMAASFMASTAILLIIGALSFVGADEHTGGVWHALNISGATDEPIIALKLLLLLADFFVAFFCFSMAIRYFNHVGYMITAPETDPVLTRPSRVAAYLNRAGNFYSFGMRAFFYCVPIVFWFFGPEFMVLATAVLLLAFYPFDRTPGSV